MKTKEIAERLVEYCRKGQWEAAQKELYAENVVSHEPYATPGVEKVTIGLQAIIDNKLAAAADQPHGLLLITDLEALHPYLRMNTIEAKLQGKIRCPVVVLYPGKREGKTSLRFLEFYPADPNYRSEHIG